MILIRAVVASARSAALPFKSHQNLVFVADISQMGDADWCAPLLRSHLVLPAKPAIGVIDASLQATSLCQRKVQRHTDHCSARSRTPNAASNHHLPSDSMAKTDRGDIESRVAYLSARETFRLIFASLLHMASIRIGGSRNYAHNTLYDDGHTTATWVAPSG